MPRNNATTHRTPKTIPHYECRYLGRYCYADKAANFLRMDEEAFLALMKRRFAQVSPYPVDPHEIASWRRSFRLMKSAFQGAQRSYDATLIFEYVIPTNFRDMTPESFREQNGSRADVIILTKRMTTIVEVKDRTAERPDVVRLFSKQAKGYGNRLRKFRQPTDRRIKTMLVLLQEEGLSRTENKVWHLSPDTFREKVLRQCIGTGACADPRAWMEEDWAFTA